MLLAGYLEGKGIAPTRLVTHRFGKTQFEATNATCVWRLTPFP
jgi:hypothetical protein